MHISIEIISLLIFGFYFYKAWKNKGLALLLAAAAFAFVFENVSIIISAGQSGNYYYSDSFRLFLFETPLFIILLWSVIIYSSYHIIKRLVSGPAIYFLAPVYVLMLDIVLDQIATGLGLWTWVGFEHYIGLYSVPAANYIGWLLLPFFFLLIWDYWSDRIWRWLTPFLAFIAYALFAFPLYLAKVHFFDHDPRLQYGIFFLILGLIASLGIYLYEPSDRSHPRDRALFLVRPFIHLFSLLFLIINFKTELVWLVIVFVFIISLEVLVFWEYKKIDS